VLAYEARALTGPMAGEDAGQDGFKIWVRDVKRGISTRLTSAPGVEMCPLFTPDGRELLFSQSVANQPTRVVARSLDGSGSERVVLEDAQKWPCMEVFAPGSTLVLYDRQKGRDSYDLWQLDTVRPGAASPLLATQFSSSRPSVSPDGRWLAFQSSESGREEVYVTSITGKGRRWQISSTGGREPQWGSDGRELLFVSSQNQLVSVAVTTSPAFDAGESRPLLGLNLRPELGRNRYVMSRDGNQFLVQSPKMSAAPVTVLLNWTPPPTR
jgi:Tol biopolymer transport system component